MVALAVVLLWLRLVVVVCVVFVFLVFWVLPHFGFVLFVLPRVWPVLHAQPMRRVGRRRLVVDRIALTLCAFVRSSWRLL